MKLGHLLPRPICAPQNSSAQFREDVAFCDHMLGKVASSFSNAIRQLPDTLCLPVCVFYLVLRALDTVEDEAKMSKFDGIIDVKAQRGAPKSEQRLAAQRSVLCNFFLLHSDGTEGP